MTDIHSHLIPEVDDGSFSLEMSEIMIFMAYQQGVRTFFTTPHSSAFLADPERVRKNYQSLKEQTEKLPLGIKIFPGCEVRCDIAHMGETMEHLKSGRFPSMNGTRYVLTEFSVRIQPSEALQIIFLMRKAGWRPVIAHMERYPFLDDGKTTEKMLNMGCFLQINAYSLEKDDEGDFKRARKLLLEEKVSFLGSDTHRMNHRPPSVEKGLCYLYEHCSGEYADAVAFENARKYLLTS